jgi:hypothetical protein
MFSAMRRRVTFVNVAVTFALVFAMSGGAFAAGKFLITSTKQIKPSVLKQLQGKTGAAGAQGPVGPVGAQGPRGAEGKPGGTGPEGKVGATGPKGETGAKGTAGPPGPQGAPGAAGAEGKEGSPWTAGGTLPSGKTETGTWVVGPSPGEEPGQPLANTVHGFAALSFPIPLAAGLDSAHVHLVRKVEVEEEKVPAECTVGGVGGSSTNPLAASGNLCLYEGAGTHGFSSDSILIASPSFSPGAGTSGAFLLVGFQEQGSEGAGSWAVTAP